QIALCTIPNLRISQTTQESRSGLHPRPPQARRLEAPPRSTRIGPKTPCILDGLECRTGPTPKSDLRSDSLGRHANSCLGLVPSAPVPGRSSFRPFHSPFAASERSSPESVVPNELESLRDSRHCWVNRSPRGRQVRECGTRGRRRCGRKTGLQKLAESRHDVAPRGPKWPNCSPTIIFFSARGRCVTRCACLIAPHLRSPL